MKNHSQLVLYSSQLFPCLSQTFSEKLLYQPRVACGAFTVCVTLPANQSTRCCAARDTLCLYLAQAAHKQPVLLYPSSVLGHQPCDIVTVGLPVVPLRELGWDRAFLQCSVCQRVKAVWASSWQDAFSALMWLFVGCTNIRR